MTINRRHLLGGAALAGTAAAFPLSLARAQTSATGGAAAIAQAPAFRRFTLGDWVVTALSDGGFPMPARLFPELSEEDFAALLEDAFLPPEAVPAAVNAFMLQQGGRTILIDTGAAGGMGPSLGKLPENMAAAGVAPEDVETVLLTHMHGDHIGGLVAPDGAAVFPNAQVIVAERELSFWTDPAQADAIPEPQRGTVAAVQGVQAAYEGRLTTFAEGGAVIDGVEPVALYGHTPGHTGFRISGGGEELLIWGDIIHAAPLQLPSPEVYIGFDVTPEEAVATRQRIMEEVAEERIMVAGMHLPFPGFGHLSRDGDGYRLVPAPWQYTI
ncbi:MBL fold metallo-hydrolase [Acuticoccus yangtzensis]|uniref:MBL fold metallo-hydrolase n=1 Tax=Acuticoccus yangtzensis TaxID=1443441 RepID=UPI000949838E|nr:MBL fold metallo-hydrolase [Acuticoccus yangtzensis]